MKKTLKMGLPAVFLLAVLGLTGCGQGDTNPKRSEGQIAKAVAVLHPTEGSNVLGVITFNLDKKGGIRVIAVVNGLTPGKHGFHIHEYGDCSSADATSAGNHFNPKNMPHAGPTAEKRHDGDLGNLEANANGVAKLDYVDGLLTFEGPASIIGRGVIVHAQPDDFTTQPTGAAGARVACGVIGVAKH